MVDGFYNHPSIVMWVPLQRRLGPMGHRAHRRPRQKWDPTRLVNSASGWTDRGVGDVHDIHAYPGPAVPPLEENRAAVLGEFGGLGPAGAGPHLAGREELGLSQLHQCRGTHRRLPRAARQAASADRAQGLAAAVYTQTTDVEIEVNGLMTYDRALVKMDADAIAAAAQRLYTPPPKRVQQGNTWFRPRPRWWLHDPYFSIWSPADQLTTPTPFTGPAGRIG
jgi:hypothetical protein